MSTYICINTYVDLDQWFWIIILDIYLTRPSCHLLATIGFGKLSFFIHCTHLILKREMNQKAAINAVCFY